MTRSTSPLRMQSTTFGEPSPIFLIFRTGTPIREIASAVPEVAITSKPRSWKRVASCVAAGLSESVTLMKIVPFSGSETPAAACALPKAVGKSSAMPITSPVLRISGPRTASAPAKRAKGRTASLTLTWVGASLGSSWSASDSPSIRRQAIFASGVPIALLTKGTVREARGLASITKSSPSATAYCTLISPITPSSRAILRVVSRISSSISSPRLIGGITQAESPEWTPASSTCCITPAT